MKWQAPTRTVAPAETLVSVADAKTHCRIDDTASDSYIASLIAMAESRLDGYSGITGLALVTQTWAQKFDGFGTCIELPLAPVQSVAITYFDANNSSQTLSSSTYNLATDALGARIELADGRSWPSTYNRPDAVTVTFVCGYGAASAVPKAIVHAALVLIGHYYEDREAQNSVEFVEFAVGALLRPFRRVSV